MLVRRITALLLGLGAILSCGDDTPTGGSRVSSLVLSRTSVKMLTGGTIDVDATPLDQSGQLVASTTVDWSSSNPSVATVSPLGVVTSLAPGVAFIRAFAEGAIDSLRVEVATVSFGGVWAGGGHVCALTPDGEAYCWGENFNGALGTGDTISNPTPLAVATSLRFTALTVSPRTTCGIAVDGAAYCWGSNGSGQLGIGNADTEDHPVPAAVTGGLTFTALSAGIGSTCGVASGGAGYCWGSNVGGLLGDGLENDAAAPSAIAGGLSFTTVSVGQIHACGITTDGSAYCWGEADVGRLGNGTDLGECGGVSPSSCSRTPLAVSGGLTFQELSASATSTCGITTTGAGYCWGAGGDLGDGTTTTSNVPVAVAGGLTLHGLVTGYDPLDANEHTCAIDDGGAGRCWGANQSGQLGTGVTTPRELSPVLVTGGLTWTQLAAAAHQTCGLAGDGRVYCWGVDANSLTPVVVPGQS